MSTRAFTLVELMVVVTVIAILASIGYAAMSTVLFAAKKSQTQAVIAKVDAAMRNFRTDMGFYPKGECAKPPYVYETNGFAKGLVKTDAASGLPVPDNDDVWAPAGAPTTWAVGNGLYARLGVPSSAASSAAKALAVANAEIVRKVENERFYHIGHFGDMSADSVGLGISDYMTTAAWNVTDANRSKWAYYDLVGPATLGEFELKKVFDHYRLAARRLVMSKVSTPTDTPWTAPAITGSTPAVTMANYKNSFASSIISLYRSYVTLARPRDAADAYRRALRDGVAAGSIPYDIPYVVPDTGPIAATQCISTSVTVASSSQPWSDGYLCDLEPRYAKDVDGDAKVDILDAYRNPLVYVNEGLPASPAIVPPPTFASMVYWADVMHYHPDPNNDPGPANAHSCNANTGMLYVTDTANAKGVVTRYDAMDIAVINDQFGANYSTVNNVGAFTGLLRARYMEPNVCGEPYILAGTLIPSRARVTATPSGVRGLVPYFCLSKDGTKLVEPFVDANGDGQWNSGERYIDQLRIGNTASPYHDNVAANDLRLCALAGDEREFELWSAGPDGRFHAVRGNTVNVDNIRTRSRK